MLDKQPIDWQATIPKIKQPLDDLLDKLPTTVLEWVGITVSLAIYRRKRNHKNLK